MNEVGPQYEDVFKIILRYLPRVWVQQEANWKKFCIDIYSYFTPKFLKGSVRNGISHGIKTKLHGLSPQASYTDRLMTTY
jgi:hypothetical protein